MKAIRAVYHLCPRCFRAVPAAAEEHYCMNDGTRLVEGCPGCGRSITSPYARFCPGCGRDYSEEVPQVEETDDEGEIEGG